MAAVTGALSLALGLALLARRARGTTAKGDAKDKKRDDALIASAQSGQQAIAKGSQLSRQMRGTRKAMAKQKLEQIKQRLKVLQSMPLDSPARVRELARLARELKGVAREYRQAGGAGATTAGGGLIDLSSLDVADGDADAAEVVSTDAAETATAAADGATVAATVAGTANAAAAEAEQAAARTGDGEKSATSSKTSATADNSDDAAEAKQDREFAKEIRRVARLIKAMIEAERTDPDSDEGRAMRQARKDVETARRQAQAIAGGLGGGGVAILV